jgi:hypothetical protein
MLQWSIALYDAETQTLGKVDQKYPRSFDIWCWRRIEKISWTDLVRNDEVLHSIQKEGISYVQGIERMLTVLITPCVETLFKNTLLKER